MDTQIYKCTNQKCQGCETDPLNRHRAPAHVSSLNRKSLINPQVEMSVGYTVQRSTGSVAGVEAERLQMKAPG